MANLVGVVPPPPGTTPDFFGKSDLQWIMIAVYVTMSAIASLALVLRLYTAMFIVRQVGLDSALIVLAWAVYLASFIGMIVGMPCALGKHLWNTTSEQVKCTLGLLPFLATTYFWPPTLTKLSLIILFRRINPTRPFRIVLYALGSFVLTYTIVFTVLVNVPCNPTGSGDTGQGRAVMCLDKVNLASAIFAILTDTAMILLPIWMLWGLNISMKQKISVGFILGLGSATVIVTCIRIIYIQSMGNKSDFPYYAAIGNILCIVEVNVGILCNCLVTLRPFLKKHIPCLIGLIENSNGRKSNRRDGGPVSNSGKRSKRTASYQLHSFAREEELGPDKDLGDDSRDSSGVHVHLEPAPEEVERQSGPQRNAIMVTTEVVVGRSNVRPQRSEKLEDVLGISPLQISYPSPTASRD